MTRYTWKSRRFHNARTAAKFAFEFRAFATLQIVQVAEEWLGSPHHPRTFTRVCVRFPTIPHACATRRMRDVCEQRGKKMRNNSAQGSKLRLTVLLPTQFVHSEAAPQRVKTSSRNPEAGATYSCARRERWVLAAISASCRPLKKRKHVLDPPRLPIIKLALRAR